jgi:hypothetical protein
MSARITVVSGPGQGKSFSTNAPMIMVGENANCEVPLETSGLAGLALLVEPKQKDFLVHNQMQQSIWLDSQELASEGSATLRNGQDIRFANGLTLKFEIERKPSAASTRPLILDALKKEFVPTPSFGSPSERREAPTAVEPVSAAKRVAQCVGIFTCLGLLIAMILGMREGDNAQEGSPATPFAEVVEKLTQNPDPNALELRDRLRTAVSGRERGDDEAASGGFQSIRDELMSRDSQGEFKFHKYLEEDDRRMVEVFVWQHISGD